VEAPGFQRSETSNITLTANADLEIPGKLKVGGAAETVTVDASALQVETANTQLQQTISDSEIENLPMLGRDAASLQKLAPGVVESSDRFGGFSTNGSQTTSNSYLLDGVDNNDGPLQDEGLVVNPDALAEENIISSTLNPEFARNGGAVVNQVLKSGTNQIHGSGFEYYRDTFMNNGNYFTPPGGRPSAVSPESLWGHAGRTDSEGQAFPLCRVPGLPQPDGNDHRDSGLSERRSLGWKLLERKQCGHGRAGRNDRIEFESHSIYDHNRDRHLRPDLSQHNLG
jgi:hypothetical protein